MAVIRVRLGRGAIIASLLAAGLMVPVYLQFQHDIGSARTRISAGSQLVQTPCGAIEYAVAGSGPPVLVVHGAGGGYDQGLDLAEGLIKNGFRVIAMSRFGYLRTPLPADTSPQAQADAHACLLDALNVRRAGIVGASAGAPSAMQFALRYPERAAALVLLVPAAYPSSMEQRAQGAIPRQTSAAARFLADAALKSDFIFWAALRLAPAAMDRTLLGIPAPVVQAASATERARVARIMDHLLPFSARRLGVLNDASITPSLPRYELERIGVPTLVASAADDLYGTYEGARYSAEHIPNARFIGYPSGGHPLVEHQEELNAEIGSFFRDYVR